ncbi:hypothetical protein EDD11_004996 [Mortierella claussenii]|nr:hypothetical protein EDD11_004996 [Mortierella claussenii]
MSLRLAAPPSASSQAHLLCNRIQTIFYRPTAVAFSTSTTTLSSCPWKVPRTHRQDGLPLKKIFKKAKKAEFTDSPTTGAVKQAAKGEGSAPTVIMPEQTVEAKFSERVRPQPQPSPLDYSGNSSSATTTKRLQRIPHDSKNHHRPGHDYKHASDTQQPRSSRLKYEDLFPSRHHRKHLLHRQRLLNYLRHQQVQQQRHQSRSHGREGHSSDKGDPRNSGGGDPRGYNPWWSQRNGYWNPWLWHIAHPRRSAVWAFWMGVLITGSGIWIYNANTNFTQQWNSFVDDLTLIKHYFREAARISASSLSNPSLSAVGAVSTSVGTAIVKGAMNGLPTQGLHGSQKQVKMMTPEQVELRLGQHQQSFRISGSEKGIGKDRRSKSSRPQELVAGYCVSQLPSNYPIEDDLSRHVVRGDNGELERVFFGVFDGHSGWCCSQKVARELAPSVARELDRLGDHSDTKAVMEAIERGFTNLDQRIVHDAVKRVLEHSTRPLACSSLLPAISGSCALMAYVDPQEHNLYVACAGDSRAVMGVREPLPDGGHVWRAVPLSFDQTGRNPWEVKRLQDEHPAEKDTVIKRGRVLGGLEPTRAFGDARYKWSKDIQDKVFRLFPAYRQPNKYLSTPPYVTAKPVVRHHKLQPEDRFMIMATDGLWDKLTSEEAVQLVGNLLDGKVGHDEMVLNREEIKKYRQKRRALPQTTSDNHHDGAQTSILTQQQEDEEELTPVNMTPKGPASQIRKFTYRDQANASTHLIRNALGGADDDKVAATLSIPSPMSRVYRDDITVTVVFFGGQNTTLALSDAQKSDGLVEIH